MWEFIDVSYHDPQDPDPPVADLPPWTGPPPEHVDRLAQPDVEEPTERWRRDVA
jgi:hypothetical protein